MSYAPICMGATTRREFLRMGAGGAALLYGGGLLHAADALAATERDTLHFLTRPDLHPPRLTVTHGAKTAPGAGHWHIYLNGKYNAYSVDPIVGVTSRLAPGVYAVTAELANNDHSSVAGVKRTRAMTVHGH